MFYNRLLSLCSENEVRITKVILDLGMGTGNLSSWKSGNIPKADTLARLADYFGVSVDYLLGQDEESERAKGFLPERLKEAINGMDCEELYQKFHYKPKIISDYLEGKRKPLNAILFQIATDLGVNPEWLYGHEGAPKYKNPVPADVDDLLSTLIHNFEQLNREGRERLVETSDDMVSSGKYIKSDKNQLGKEEGA